MTAVYGCKRAKNVIAYYIQAAKEARLMTCLKASRTALDTAHKGGEEDAESVLRSGKADDRLATEQMACAHAHSEYSLSYHESR